MKDIRNFIIGNGWILKNKNLNKNTKMRVYKSMIIQLTAYADEVTSLRKMKTRYELLKEKSLEKY